MCYNNKGIPEVAMRRLIVLMFILLVSVSLWADDEASVTAGVTIDSAYMEVQPILLNNSGTKKVTVVNPFAGAWAFYVRIIVVIGGGLMLLRLAAEVVGALIFNGENGPEKLRQVILRFIAVVTVVGFAFALVWIIF